MGRFIRLATSVAVVLLVAIVLRSSEARAVDSDSDADALMDARDQAMTHYRDVLPATVPQATPDDVADSSLGVSLVPFLAVQPRILPNFVAEYGRTSDFTDAVGVWNGPAWIDRFVRDPVRHFAGISIVSPDAVRAWQGVVPVAVAAGHSEGTGKVEFRVDGALKATVPEPVGDQYRWNWDTTSLGDRLSILNATQYDGVAARAWSQMTVKVDNLPPNASWTSPVHGSTVSGIVTLRMIATDFYGIREVRFYADGVLIGNGIPEGGGSYRIFWDTTKYCNSAPRILSATAVEETSVAKTRTVFVELNLNNDPLVCLTQPAAGGTVSGTAYPVRAATVSAIGVTKVEFLVDVAPLGDPPQLRFTDTAAPWEWLWDTTRDPNGPVLVTAKAYNMAGKVDTDAVRVSISNAICSTCGGTTAAPSPAKSSHNLDILAIGWPAGPNTTGTLTTVVADLTSTRQPSDQVRAGGRVDPSGEEGEV